MKHRRGSLRSDILGGLIGAVVGAILLLAVAGFVALSLYDNPPVQFVPGIPEDHLVVADAAQAQYPQSFQDASGLTEEQSAANERKNIRLWGPSLKLNPGPQQIGDCASWAAAHTLQVCVWKSTGGKEVREVSTLFLYGLGRVTVGRKRPPCNSDGGYPTYFAQGIEQRGFLFVEEAGLPAYSGSAAKRVGCDGPTSAQLQLAKTRAGGSAQPVADPKAIRNAICAGYPCTLAFSWSPGKPYVSEGKRCLAFNGARQGGHAVCLIGYDGSSGKPYWYLMNSHGPGFAGGPLGDEPPGGVWIDERWMTSIIDSGAELWAISNVPGFSPDALDLHIFDELTASAPPRISAPVSLTSTQRTSDHARQTVLAP